MLQICEVLQGHLAGTLPGACRQPSYLSSHERSRELSQELEQDCRSRLIYTSRAGNIPCAPRLLLLTVMNIRKFEMQIGARAHEEQSAAIRSI